MKKFIERIEKICKANKKVAFFIDMDGTIIVYDVYPENVVNQKMQEKYNDMMPAQYIIDMLEEINKISNVDLYILSLSKTIKITNEKKKWLKKYVPFIKENNWIIITKELNEYSKENRDIIKAQKMQEMKDKYNHLILLDDDHRILKETQNLLSTNADVFHVSAALI